VESRVDVPSRSAFADPMTRIRKVSTGSIMYLPTNREKKKRATGRI